MPEHNAGPRPRRARVLAALAGVVGVLVSIIFSAIPASAVAAPALTEETTASNSTNFKNLTVRCPAGKKVYGAAFNVINGLGKVAVNTVQPNAGLTEVFFEANEVGTGISTSWSLNGEVICGNSVATLQRVTGTAANSTSATKTLNIACPAGLKAYGAGHIFSFGYGEIFLTGITYNNALTNTSFSANNDDDAITWGMTGYVICGTPSPSQQVVIGSGFAQDSSNEKSTTVFCPADTKLHGTGFIMNGGGTANHDLVAEDVTTTAALRSVTAKAFENDSTNQEWFVTPQAICAA